MRLESFACLGSNELSNGARVASYVTNVGVPFATMGVDCQCPQLDEGFITPIDDPAPWYEPTRPESADFLGFWASDITMEPVMGRNVAESGRMGSTIGSLRAKGRVVTVAGLMMARSGEGMSYGERWLSEVLRGSPCNDGGCAADDLTILPACPELPGYDETRYFRTLVNVGVVDGPVFSPVIRKEHATQQAAFTLVSSMPYLYHPAERCLNGVDSTTLQSCSLTTPEWMGDGTFVITVENVDTVATTNLVITGTVSLDGTCPVSGLGASVPASYTYTIPTLAPGDRITIDGARRQALYYDASCKSSSSALPYVTFTGPWKWPDVGPCTTMCLTLDSAGGETSVTVDRYLREY